MSIVANAATYMGTASMKHENGLCALAALLVLAAPNLMALASTTLVPQSEPLLQSSSLSYVGSFRVAEGTTNQTSFNYGGSGLAYDPTNNGLFMTGHAWYQRTAEISIPTPAISSTISALPQATFVQQFSDSLNGGIRKVDPTDPNPQHIGGYLVDGKNLIVSVYSIYDGGGSQSSSHFVRPLSLTGSGPVLGPYRVGNQYPGFVSGYMTLVPPEWQALLGGPALTGNCCLSIVSEQSNGPALSVFDPSELGVKNPTPATPLVGYPLSHPLGTGWGTQSVFFNGSTSITGVVFPVSSRSVLFFGVQGTGPFCYGPGTSSAALAGTIVAGTASEPWCYDPSNASKGPHAFPYVYQVWAYDADDFLAVESGSKKPYDLLPYATWNLQLPYANATSPRVLNGAAYDPITNRIFVEQGCVDTACSPIIDVFQISGNTAATTSPPKQPTPPSDVIVH